MRDEVTSTLFGMAGLRVLAVDEDDADGAVHVLVELERDDAPCPGCGTFSASVKQRPVVRLADAPAGGREVTVFRHKRRLRCEEEFCATASFTQQAPEHLAPRGRPTERLRSRWPGPLAADRWPRWPPTWARMAHRVAGGTGRRHLGPGPGQSTRAAPPRHRRDQLPPPGRFATGFVDLDTGRLVDLVEGRSKSLVSEWLAGLDEGARAAIVEAALDPYARYNAPVREALPRARITVDKFHAIRLANQVVTSVRC